MMTGYYTLSVVALSIAIAIIASYTALDLANRVSESASSRRKAWTWMAAGAVSMGTGIWSMHFIGMLAFHLPIAVAYDLPATCLSMLIAIAVSAIALFVLRRRQVTTRSLIGGAMLMGIGISAMHYTGMIAMRMFPAIRYDPLLFMTSVLIAVFASLAALWIALQLRRDLSGFAVPAKLASAAVMGLAISGMHYTGMAAARFAPDSMCLAVTSGGLKSTTLAIVVGCIAMAIMSLTIILSTLDAHFAVKSARLADSLQLAKDGADAALRENEKITAELRAAQSELVSSARQAGMSEIATNVLHNVGNVLNSVNVSATLASDLAQKSKAAGLGRVVALMREHEHDLGEFIASDPRGKHLPVHLGHLADHLKTEQAAIVKELDSLRSNIEHIKDIVAMQQSYAKVAGVHEIVAVVDLLEDSLRMNTGALARHGVEVVRDFEGQPLVNVDKHKVLQILVNLVRNAKYACSESGLPGRRVTLSARSANGRARIMVADNGVGIASENLTRIFNHGFTTRADGHGFGLHSGALAARELGGTLSVQSDGVGRGAAFSLELPLYSVETADA